MLIGIVRLDRHGLCHCREILNFSCFILYYFFVVVVTMVTISFVNWMLYMTNYECFLF